MATAPGEIAETEEPARPEKQRWGWKRWLLGIFLSIIGLIILLLIAIDTPPGRRFIIDQIENLEPENGLRIKIGRIDGSIYGGMTISDLRLYDPDGLFFEVPELEVDWRPFTFITSNRLRVERAESELAILHRAPALIPSEEENQPILPGFDIYVGSLDIDRFRFEEAVAGERQVASVTGNVDIRNGRAQVDLNARSLTSGERMALVLDAEPDGDVFDIDLQLAAPEDGIVAGLTGIQRALTVDINGSGTWSDWDGQALVDSGDARVMNLDLDAADGIYSLGGVVRTQALFEPGIVTRLTGPETNFSATGTFEDQLLNGEFSIRSAAAVIDGRGGVDLSTSSFEGLVADIRMLRPQALAEDLSGRDVRMNLRLSGPFQRAGFAYRLTSPRAAFGTTVFEGLVAEGEGRITETPYRLPLSARARRITGVGAQAESILRDVSIDGQLLITEEQIVGDDIRFRSVNSRGTADVLYQLSTGQYVVGVDGELSNFYVEGLGRVDLRTTVDIRPGRSGGFEVGGRARIVTRSLENSAIANITGSLPVIDANIAYGPDGAFRFSNASVRSSGLDFDGSGSYSASGRLELTGTGRSAQYGAFSIRASGPASRPAIVANLSNPLPAARLEDVDLALNPQGNGYAYNASGQSMAGPFTSDGFIDLGSPVSVDVNELLVADTRTTGQLTLASQGIVGDFDLTGNGLTGDIALQPVDGVQGVSVDLIADEANIGGQIATTVREGMLDLDAVLYDEPQINASFSAIGVRREGLSIARTAGSVDYRGGFGEATVSVAGSRGRDFDFAAEADFTPDMWTVNGGGEFEGEPITLTPLVVRREGPAWIIEESTIEYAGGGATLAGRVGGPETSFDASLDSIPLSVVDIFYPDTGFGGQITGTVAYRQEASETIPTADVAVRVRSLTRAGFALRPRPVNFGINARLMDRQMAGRAIMESDGEEIMRAQFRLNPFSGSGSFGEQLTAAPLFAELRYNGPAQTIWQLTGNEAFSVSGPIFVRADATGSLNSPDYLGEIQTQNVRFESAVTGTVVEGITTTGTFQDARFTLPDFSGTTLDGGTISGSAAFDLGLAGGLGMDIQLQADRAWLMRRDDISARASGPIAITLQTPPGTVAGTESALPVGRITGDLEIIEGEFQLGQASPATQVPQLNVTEINERLDEPVQPPPAIDWELAVDVDANNRFLVRGLGLDSEWGADLQVRGALANFRILGQMDLVRGAYTFAGKRFELERGRIDFYGNTPINPSLDIIAAGDLDNLDAQIAITGTGDSPDIAFTSNPALPQSELMSRLLFGDSITNLSPFEALQLAAAVASLQGGGGGGLNPINAVRDAVGLDRLRIVPADPVEDRGTAVAGGLYVMRNLYVEVISDGQGYSATQTEFQVTRWLSLLSSISTIGRASASVEISRDY